MQLYIPIAYSYRLCYIATPHFPADGERSMLVMMYLTSRYPCLFSLHLLHTRYMLFRAGLAEPEPPQGLLLLSPSLLLFDISTGPCSMPKTSLLLVTH